MEDTISRISPRVPHGTLALALAGFAAVSSALVLASGDAWPLFACGVAFPLATALASLATAQ